jgi:hypothetical protein
MGGQLHVLLRHRLLAQPDGFEGFGTVAVAAMASDLPVTQCDDGERRDPHFYTAVSASADLHAADYNVIAVVEVLLGFKSERIPCREPLGKPRLDLVAATVNLLPDRDPGRNLPFDFRVKRLKRDLIVASIEGLVVPPHDLHALLRHRPRSISRNAPLPCEAAAREPDRSARRAAFASASKRPPRA